jgi:hypothetical protein
MQRRWRRPLMLALIAVAYFVLCPLIAIRVVAGPPRYRACVAALERVTVGQPWAETERHLAAAVAVGGDQEDGQEGPPETYIGPEPGTTWVTCYRNGSAVAEPRRYVIGSVWVWLVSVEPRLNSVIPFAPADYTWLQVTRRADAVATKRLLDCLHIVVLDNYGGSPYDRPGCRPHSPADE